ncbi:MAG: hypothetical protein JO039_08060, partial [Solirubrobacterales bacterium]|nr:hypothetical protein [Solirubrobacterales bacterium]
MRASRKLHRPWLTTAPTTPEAFEIGATTSGGRFAPSSGTSVEDADDATMRRFPPARALRHHRAQLSHGPAQRDLVQLRVTQDQRR